MALAMSQSLDGTYGQDTFNSKSSIRDQNFDRLGRNELFMASPDVLKFRFSQLHKTTPNIVRIINMSSEKQRIHVLDSTQPQFKFSFNGSKKGWLAPGMAEEIRIEFEPTEWKYQFECLRIHSNTPDGNLSIPIHAYPIRLPDLHHPDTGLPTPDTGFPRRVEMGQVPLGETATVMIPICCKIPVDFEFKLTPLEGPNAECFSVEPMQGVVPADGSVMIAMTYRPSAYATHTSGVQVSISDLEFEPFVCTMSGSSVPGQIRARMIDEMEYSARERAQTARTESITYQDEGSGDVMLYADATMPMPRTAGAHDDNPLVDTYGSDLQDTYAPAGPNGVRYHGGSGGGDVVTRAKARKAKMRKEKALEGFQEVDAAAASGGKQAGGNAGGAAAELTELQKLARVDSRAVHNAVADRKGRITVRSSERGPAAASRGGQGGQGQGGQLAADNDDDGLNDPDVPVEVDFARRMAEKTMFARQMEYTFQVRVGELAMSDGDVTTLLDSESEVAQSEFEQARDDNSKRRELQAADNHRVRFAIDPKPISKKGSLSPDPKQANAEADFDAMANNEVWSKRTRSLERLRHAFARAAMRHRVEHRLAMIMARHPKWKGRVPSHTPGGMPMETKLAEMENKGAVALCSGFKPTMPAVVPFSFPVFRDVEEYKPCAVDELDNFSDLELLPLSDPVQSQVNGYKSLPLEPDQWSHPIISSSVPLGNAADLPEYEMLTLPSIREGAVEENTFRQTVATELAEVKLPEPEFVDGQAVARYSLSNTPSLFAKDPYANAPPVSSAGCRVMGRAPLTTEVLRLDNVETDKSFLIKFDRTGDGQVDDEDKDDAIVTAAQLTSEPLGSASVCVMRPMLTVSNRHVHRRQPVHRGWHQFGYAAANTPAMFTEAPAEVTADTQDLSDDESDDDIADESSRYEAIKSIQLSVDSQLLKLLGAGASELDAVSEKDAVDAQHAAVAKDMQDTSSVVHPHVASIDALAADQWSERAEAVQIMAKKIATVDGMIRHKHARLILGD